MKHTRKLKTLIISLFIIQYSLFAYGQPPGTTKITGLCSVPDFWVSTTTDDAEEAPWHINTTTIMGVYNRTDGRANTNGYAWLPGTAGYICSNKSTSATGGAWYLPSQEEVLMIYSAYRTGILSGFSGNYYWSSTEYSANAAWSIYFINADVKSDYSKTVNYGVRCAWRP